MHRITEPPGTVIGLKKMNRCLVYPRLFVTLEPGSHLDRDGLVCAGETKGESCTRISTRHQNYNAVVTDSTMAPPKNRRFSSTNERFIAARHERGCYEKSIFKHFHASKGLSNDYVGAARGIIFQEIRPGDGFKPFDFVEE